MFKKIISVVLLLAACLSFAVSAEGSLQTYIYKNGDIEIQIQHTDFTEEELARIVDRLENGDPGISAQNLCAPCLDISSKQAWHRLPSFMSILLIRIAR